MKKFFVLSATLSAALLAPKAQAKPNILFIISDDLNCDLGAYGHALVQSPNIDALAKRGLKFERAYCQSPLCNPSRASLMTGLRPDTTGVMDLKINFRQNLPDVVTLPQLFKNNGYFSARVGKIYHYGVPSEIGTSGMDDAASWNQVSNPIGRDKDDEDTIYNATPPRKLGSALAWREDAGTGDEQTDGKVASEAIRLLEENQNKPFFLAVGFFRPHCPYVAPKTYFDLYDFERIQLPPAVPGDLDGVPLQNLYSHGPAWQIGDADKRRAIRAYYASVSLMDAQVGRVLDALERLKLRDNTIIVFTSDHGYLLGQHGQWMKQMLWEEANRVPLIVATPSQKTAGQSTRALAELVDVYPTLADLCGLKAPANLAGKSLRPVLEDPTAKVKVAAFSQIENGGVLGRSVRTDRFGFNLWNNKERSMELYDHQSDAGEHRNLAALPQYAATVEELRGLLVAPGKS